MGVADGPVQHTLLSYKRTSDWAWMLQRSLAQSAKEENVMQVEVFSRSCDKVEHGPIYPFERGIGALSRLGVMRSVPSLLTFALQSGGQVC